MPVLSWAAVLIFVAALIATSLETNRPLWVANPKARDPEAAATAAERNARLLVLAYAWGGLSMLAVYWLSGLHWQHGSQYAAAMGLMAVLLLGYVWMLAQPGSRLRRPRALALAAQLSALQALGALGELAFLLLSGKLSSIKGDWAANQIFLGGGVAVLVLSTIASFTQYKLMRAEQRSARMPQVSIGE